MSLNNEVRLIGNIVKEPTIIESEKGNFGRIRIASNTKRGDKEDTLFIDVKLFGYAYKDLEYHALEKGDRVVVYGRLSIDEYDDKEGKKRREPVVYGNSVMKVARRKATEEAKSF